MSKRMPSCFGILVLSVLILSTLAQAQTKSVMANNKGEQVILDFSAADAGTQEAEFWFVSRGNSSNALFLTLVGPYGITGRMESHIMKGSPEATLKETKGWTAVDTKERLRLRASSTVQAVQVSAASDCSFLSQEVYEGMLRYWNNQGEWPIGQNPSLQEVCEWLLSGGGGGGTGGGGTGGGGTGGGGTGGGGTGGGGTGGGGSYDAGYLYTSALIHKDSCSGDSKKTKYVVRLVLNLTGIDQNLFTNGFQIKVNLYEQPWTGKRAATIKPVSDGKYAPAPLILMSSVGGWGGNEQIKVFRWSGGKSSLIAPIRVEDYVGYFGLRLARGKVAPALRGGKGTFEISNGNYAYSVCFRLVRTRQKVNGYPGNG